MPLHEFLKMFQETLESSQPKAPSSPEISAGPENELVELVWENGQIMMQGQSSRAKKSPLLNDFQSQPPGVQDRYTGNATNPKVEKFDALSSTFSDATSSVPLGEMYLDQEDDMVPWLNYPEDEAFNKDFCFENSPEISGVTRNEPSSHNSFSSLGKGSLNQMLQHSHVVPDHINASLGARNAPKVSSSRTGFLNSYMSSQGQTSIPSFGSGVSNVDTNTASKVSDSLFGESVQGQASTGGFRSMKIQKQNVGLPGSGSSFLNFSHFSKPASLFRANLEKSDSLAASCSSGIEKMGNEKVSAASSSTPNNSAHVKPCSNSRKEICFNSQPKWVSSKFDLRSSVVKPLEESCHIEQSDALHRDDSMKRPSQASGASTAKEVTDVHKTVEPVVAASSVCSGNSGEGASNDQMHNSKRKNRENDESESRSEDVEEESMVVKKAHARGGSGSKRSRAADVHNLSERRRRDRINEKMRALQELIPNCNKADKASMLDEAIEYLKTLQLQVQMMSTGAGLCMLPMMFPTGLQHIHPAHVPHFPPFAGGVGMGMGFGMGMGMGFGMGMLDMNAGSPRFPIYPVPPIPGAHFPPVPISASSTLQGIAGTNLQVFGHPSQGLPMSVPRAPSVPLMGQASINSAVGLNATRIVVPTEAPSSSQTFKSDNPLQNENSQLMGNADANSSINQTTNQLQATNKNIDQSALATKDDQVANVGGDSESAVNLAPSDVVSTKGVD